MSIDNPAKKARICHMTSAHKRYDVRIFEKECRSLSNNGYDVTLIVNDSNEDEVKDNVRIISIKHEHKSRIKRILNSQKLFLRKAIDIDSDIYHFHDPELLPVGNKLRKRGKKVIFDSHENYTLQIREKHYIPKVLRGLISKVYNIYETYSVKKFDAVVFPCTFKNVNPFENRANKTVFIDNVPILEELYDKYNSTSIKGDRTICHVGGLTYGRGITHLIRATNKARVKLILAGVFSPKDYFTEVKKMEEFSSVDYRGHVNRDEVAGIYEKSKIGMCNILNIGQYNKSDNFATKVYEYMSMGLPVILSDYPYARDVLRQYKFGITVDPENIDEITKAISFLLENTEEAFRMGQEGRRAIKEKFNWRIEEKKLLELYENIIFRNINDKESG